MRLIFKNLNILRSTINAISMNFELKEIIESAGNNLPNLFDFSSFAVLWKEGPVLYLYQEESCPSSFTEEVKKNITKVWSILGDEQIGADRINVQIEKRKLRSRPLDMDPRAALKSHLTLPLAIEG
ncbi:MAG: hypothetical protein EHM36_07595, partial [Deltaproteobacteria bacterium]